MHPLEAQQLFDLSAGAYSAITAALQTDDIEQRAGLMVAAEHLTGELKRITWQYVESAEIDEARPRIDPIIARSLNPLSDLRDLAEAINRATGDGLNADAIKLVMVDEGEAGWLVRDETTKRFVWHVTTDGRLTKQSNDE